MKKLLLLLAVGILSFSAFSQNAGNADYYICGNSNWFLAGFPIPDDTTVYPYTVYYNNYQNDINKNIKGPLSFSTNSRFSTTQWMVNNQNASGSYSYTFPESDTSDQNAGLGLSLCAATITKKDDGSGYNIACTVAKNITLTITEALPFVTPVAVKIPEGVNVFVTESYADNVLQVKPYSETTITANTPVILKVSQSGTYTFDFAEENANVVYNVQNGKDSGNTTRYWIKDSQNGYLYGVQSPHLVPENGYYYDGTKFVKAVTQLVATSTVIEPLNCYLLLPEGTEEYPESISIEFPKETYPDGYYLVNNMTTNFGGDFNPNPSYKFQSTDDANVLTLTVGSMYSTTEFYVKAVTGGVVSQTYSAEKYTEMKAGEEGEATLEAGLTDIMSLDGNYTNVTFTLTLVDGVPNTLSYEYDGEINSEDSWTISPGNDQTMQSGTVNGNTITLALERNSTAGLVYIYLPTSYDGETLYYSITEEKYNEEDSTVDETPEVEEDEVEDSGDMLRVARRAEGDATLNQATIYTGEEDARYIAISVKKGMEGEIQLYSSDNVASKIDGAAFNYKVSSTMIPTSVEAVAAQQEDGVMYNIFGQRVDENYKGIVIKNGKKYILK